MRYHTHSIRLEASVLLFVCLLLSIIFTHLCDKDKNTHPLVCLCLCLSQFLSSKAGGRTGPAWRPFWPEEGRAPGGPSKLLGSLCWEYKGHWLSGQSQG